MPDDPVPPTIWTSRSVMLSTVDLVARSYQTFSMIPLTAGVAPLSIVE